MINDFSGMLFGSFPGIKCPRFQSGQTNRLALGSFWTWDYFNGPIPEGKALIEGHPRIRVFESGLERKP